MVITSNEGEAKAEKLIGHAVRIELALSDLCSDSEGMVNLV
jgi:hypothetical protein